ncbi:hypothetical protein QC764_110950 [Podospora pseudoanserina]|uniref:ER membrane protein complex subunit 6 n=1 Tax=Podospora pseudoanserina TaxID=2609844 RepID=A0ABR0IN49_9PEZI|nr:hypothetical protein QC764_110950 [Podospora pseudoanserina]
MFISNWRTQTACLSGWVLPRGAALSLSDRDNHHFQHHPYQKQPPVKPPPIVIRPAQTSIPHLTEVSIPSTPYQPLGSVLRPRSVTAPNRGRNTKPSPQTHKPTTMPSQQELDFQISPLVQESLVHNTRTLHNLQSLTASLFGVGAGILGLESYSGFLFYLVFSLITTLLFYALRIAPTATSSPSSSSSSTTSKGGVLSRYFRSPLDFWTAGLTNGLAGFILTWTLFYGLVRA